MHATRRELLAGAGALCGATFLALRPSQATPDTLRAAIKKVVGNAEVGKGKISMDIDTARRLFTLVCVLHWKG